MLAIEAYAPAVQAEYPRWPDALLRAADRWRYLLLTGMAAIYLLGFNGQWQMEPDSALYLSLARNLARGLGYTYQGAAHHLVYPGIPYLLSALFRLFPNHELAACDALVLLCGFGAMAMTYRLFCVACDRPTAVVVTILTGLAHEYFRYCFEIMLEMPFLFGVMAVLAGHEAIFNGKSRPRWWDWAIFSFGVFAVINTKPMMLVLLGACIVTMPWRTSKEIAMMRRREGLARKFDFNLSRRRRLASDAGEAAAPSRRDLYLRMACAAGIICGLILLFFWYDPRNALATTAPESYEHLAIREVIHFQHPWRVILDRNFTDFFGKSAARAVLGIPLGTTALGTLFGLIVLCAGVALFRVRALWGIWVLATIAKLIFLYSHDRYLVPILPLLMFGWWRFVCGVPLWLPRRLYEPVLIVLLGATLVPNLAADVLSVYQQHRRPFVANFRDGHFLPLTTMADELARRTTPGDTIVSMPRASRILSYLSDRKVIEPQDARHFHGAGRTYLVVYVGARDPALNDWMSRKGLTRKYPPIATFNFPVGHGRSIALLATRNK